MLPDLRFLRAIEPPIDDCVVQEAERRQRISVNSGFGEGKGQVAIDTAGNVFLVWWSRKRGARPPLARGPVQHFAIGMRENAHGRSIFRSTPHRI
jgi:hypothetical protein